MKYPDASVLVLIVGDTGFPDVAPYTATPTLEAFANGGLRLRQFIANPIGSHTAYSVLTGRLAVNGAQLNGWGWPGTPGPSGKIPLTTPTLPNAFRARGAQTALFGKWGMGAAPLDAAGLEVATPFTHGYAEWRAGIGGNVGDFTNWTRIDQGLESTETTWADESIGDAFVDWWPGQSGQRFAACYFAGAHGPHTSPPPASALPAGYSAVASPRGNYEAIIAAVDEQIRRMLEVVDTSSTFVFLLTATGTPDRPNLMTAQHGWGSASEQAARVKRSVFDGGIHVPAAVQGPGIPCADNDALVQACDLWALIDDRIGLGIPVGSDSRLERDYAHVVIGDESAVRSTTHKLRDLGTGPQELYELETDPGEANPIDPDTYADATLVAELRAHLAYP